MTRSNYHLIQCTVENINIKDLVPDFEPVEITQVNASKGNSYKDEDDEDDEDEDGFNDAEEITDDLLETAQTPSSVNVEDTKDRT